MSDLSGSVTDLVRAATTEADPRRLRGAVEKVLAAFGKASASDREGAIGAIGKALRSASGPGAQVLALAVGALVEAGAPPELAWPALGRDLVRLLDAATTFATAALASAKGGDFDEAMAGANAVQLAKKHPTGAAAWSALPSRCLAAIACLSRSKAVRSKERRAGTLLEAAWPLTDAIPEVDYLVQALRIVDDEALVVLSPSAGRGWRVEIDALPSNAELYILLADALTGDAKADPTFGRRPDPKAVEALRQGTPPKRGTREVKITFDLLPWTAVAADGSLPAAPSDEEAAPASARLAPEGLLADVPPLGAERIVLVQEAAVPHAIPIAPPFEGLRPKLEVVSELPTPEVLRTMVRIVTEGFQTKAANAAPDRPEAPRKTRKTRKASKASAKKNPPAKKAKKTSSKLTRRSHRS